ncbi:hypothetical protein B0O80DRAFT_416343, partial [Mortierella sp. GBAus27b]
MDWPTGSGSYSWADLSNTIMGGNSVLVCLCLCVDYVLLDVRGENIGWSLAVWGGRMNCFDKPEQCSAREPEA